MNWDTLRLVGFLLACLFSAYGGVFAYSLVHYRLLKKCTWFQSIGSSFIWMLAYAFVGTIASDIAVGANRWHPYIVTGIIILLVALPYAAAIRLFVKLRRANK